MTDRELTDEETDKFVHERRGHVFSAIQRFKEEKGKPSLHDLCILELIAITEGQKRILIEQGRELKRIKAKIKYCEFMEENR